MMRLFVAIPLPDNIRQKLSSLQTNIEGAKWSSKENLHITLCFIGDVNHIQFPAIEQSLAEIEFSPFELSLQSVGHFGSSRSPKVLWAGVSESNELAELHSKVMRILRRAGVHLDRENFRPHVTVARLSHCRFEAVGEYIEQYSLFSSEKFTVKGFNLYSSTLLQSGAQYAIEGEYSSTP